MTGLTLNVTDCLVSTIIPKPPLGLKQNNRFADHNRVKMRTMAKKKLPPEALEFFRKQGAKGGKIGGKRSLETMTAEQRSVRAKKASDAATASRTAKAKKIRSKDG